MRLLVTDHKVMSEGPGLRVENGNFIFFVVVGRGSVHVKEYIEWDEFILPQFLDQSGIGHAHCCDGSVHLRFTEEIGESFAQPYRQFREIGHGQRVVILVVHRGKGIGALRFEIHGRIVLIQAVGEYARRMHVAPGPIIGEQVAERFLVLEGENSDHGTGMALCDGESFAEQGVNLFELDGGPASLFFAGIADDDEIGRADFDPCVVPGGPHWRAGQNPERGTNAENRSYSSRHTLEH